VTAAVELKATRYDAAEGVATITLHRPHRHNAWTGRMHDEYRALLQQAESDPAIRVVVVTGSGDSFCVGADSQALAGHAERGGYDPGTPADMARPGFGTRPEFDADFAYHYGLATPVIAAVNGPCAGVGLVLACYTDLRFAARGATLSAAHGKLGLPAEYGLTWVLPRLVGLTRAADILLSSRKFRAEETEGWGLFNAIVEPGELLDHTYRYARDLATHVSPASLRATKRALYADQHRDVGSAVAESAQLLDRMMGEPDYAQGLRALLEKRPPHFS
jgi:enoyl-CoA hydratase/carnithine racemase